MLYRFGNFELDEERFELRREGELVRLSPRALETLLALVQNAGEVVTKEELIQGPWRGAAVSDSALSQSVKRARHALEYGSRSTEVITTVRGRGFRFTEAVERVPQARTGSRDVARVRVGGDEARASAGESLGVARPFFGRRVELETLRSALRTARSYQGTTVLLSGEPGVGKTRLVAQFVAELRGQNLETCWGGCREGQAAPPFWPWPEVVVRHAESHDAATVRRLAGEQILELAALNPDLAELLDVALPEFSAEGPLRTLALLRAVCDYFRRAARAHFAHRGHPNRRIMDTRFARWWTERSDAGLWSWL